MTDTWESKLRAVLPCSLRSDHNSTDDIDFRALRSEPGSFEPLELRVPESGSFMTMGTFPRQGTGRLGNWHMQVVKDVVHES